MGCFWEFKSSMDMAVPLDFLDKDGEGGSLHRLQGYTLLGDLPVATLADLAVTKGTEWRERGKEKDFDGLEYAVNEMAKKRSDFSMLEDDARERLVDILIELGLNKAVKKLARIIRRLC
ncbi:hypothetical protein HOY82DRAFT_540880 [Tuber indicum]|nr:hypothetical protein HOY82DRAFT_540880 [Tuber indicum]